MKPFQVGLLVLVGALGGALIMWFTERAKPAAAPIVSVAPTPAPLAAVPAPAAPATAPAPEAPGPKATPAAVVQMGHHTQPMLRTPPPAPVAQSMPPPQPEPPAPTPGPEGTPVQEPAAPPISVEPAPNPAPAPAPEPVQPPTPQPAPSVTLQAGMTLPVRLGESLSSEHNQAGDTFTATLDAPLTAGGFAIAEKGARVEGRVVEAQKSGHGKKATLTLELTKLDTSDGQHVAIKTEALRKQGSSRSEEHTSELQSLLTRRSSDLEIRSREEGHADAGTDQAGYFRWTARGYQDRGATETRQQQIGRAHV